MRKIILGLAAVLALSSSEAKAYACLRGDINGFQIGETSMSAKIFLEGAGHYCEFTLSTGSTTSVFDKVRVIERPRHGTAAIAGRSGVYYKGAPGYHGSDHFVIEVSGIGRTGRPGTSRISFDVEIK